MRFCSLAFYILLLTACTSSAQKEKSVQSTDKIFKLPEVPSIIVTPQERADYLAMHYWDIFDFKDTSFIHLPQITEQAFADYITILNQTSLETADNGINNLLKKAEQDSSMFAHFASLSEKYLYEPNSPMRNEEYYIPALENIIASDKMGEIYKTRYRHQYKIALRNRKGTKALDFHYSLTPENQSSLYKINARYILLFFNNPDCGDCKTVKEQIKGSATINNLIDKKELKLLSVYPDEDLAIWKQNQSEIPSSWINSYDKGVIKKQELYDLKAIPTLYLLDKSKMVLLKDVRFEDVEHFLFQVAGDM